MRSLPTLAAVLLAMATATLPGAAAANDRKVLVIGIDGLMLDRIAAADAPALDGLIASGSAAKTSLYANPMAPTLSGPGWATIATGVWPDKHRVTSNSWGTGTALAQYPDFLTRLERADRSRATYAIATRAPLVTAGTPIFSPESTCASPPAATRPPPTGPPSTSAPPTPTRASCTSTARATVAGPTAPATAMPSPPWTSASSRSSTPSPPVRPATPRTGRSSSPQTTATPTPATTAAAHPASAPR